MPTSERSSVVFVCLGNICRSPTAEGILRHAAHQRGCAERLHIESAGTGHWHVGQLPDARARATAAQHGVPLTSRAQVVDPRRHFAFDWIIPMDRSNHADLLRLGALPARVRLLRSFDPTLRGRPEHELEVPDPYSGDDAQFQEVFEMIRRACEGMLDALFTRP